MTPGERVNCLVGQLGEELLAAQAQAPTTLAHDLILTLSKIQREARRHAGRLQEEWSREP
jgi:hypothetical protein